MESPNLKVVAVLMPLEMKCHTVTHLKALTLGIEYASGHRHCCTFTLKSTHFAS